MAGAGARGGAGTWADVWSAGQRGATRWRWLGGRQSIRGFLLATVFLALGVAGGLLAGRMATSAVAHREGACVALHMAAALGYLDDRQQRVVMHNIATALNPEVDLFPGGHRALRLTCAAMAGRS